MIEFLTIPMKSIITAGATANVLVNLFNIQTIDNDQYGYGMITFYNGTTRTSTMFYVDLVKFIQDRYINQP